VDVNISEIAIGAKLTNINICIVLCLAKADFKDIAITACIRTNQNPKERGGASRCLSLLGSRLATDIQSTVTQKIGLGTSTKIKYQLFMRLASTPLSHRWLSGVEAIPLGTLIYCCSLIRICMRNLKPLIIYGARAACAIDY
jgi:hypothetical protein